MIREPVARRYARALFQAASARNTLDEVGADLEGIGRLLREAPELGQLLSAPQIKHDNKREIVGNIFRDRVHPLVFELLHLLMEKKRLVILPQIIEGYRDLSERARGIRRAEVTTAVTLPQDHEQTLVGRLEKITGHSILLEKRVDPGILGGMMVRLGDRIIDRSVRRTLLEMRHDLLNVPILQ